MFISHNQAFPQGTGKNFTFMVFFLLLLSQYCDILLKVGRPEHRGLRMPRVEIVVYRSKRGQSPLIEWLHKQPALVKTKFRDRLERLKERGPLLRRPLSAPLGKGIHELRADHQRIHYRILYGFAGKGKAVLSHGCVKEGKVPTKEKDQARKNLNNYRKDPQGHTYTGEL